MCACARVALLVFLLPAISWLRFIVQSEERKACTLEALSQLARHLRVLAAGVCVFGEGCSDAGEGRPVFWVSCHALLGQI